MSKKRAIDPNDYLKGVKRLNSLSDNELAIFLKVGRSTVWRFRVDPRNKEVIEQAENYIENLGISNLTAASMTWETYQEAPIIKRWENTMNLRLVSRAKQLDWMRSFYNLCKYLHVIPSKVTVEQCAQVVVEQRNNYYANKPQIKGIAYSRIRESVRGFFMSVHNMSGMHLTNLGVGKEALKGSGKYSRQKVPQPVRHTFEEMLIEDWKETDDNRFLDVLGNSIFNFGTATRISASLEFDLSQSYFELAGEKWKFEIWDKGSRGKKKRWEKMLMGTVLDKFKNWASLRYDIPVKNLEDELPSLRGSLFPSIEQDHARRICKAYLPKAGLTYQDFPPTHIWRHTFAQEMLWATDFNYELVASIGGWVNTGILKKHYGEMGEQAKERGLLKAMGIEVEQEKRVFQW